MSSDPSTLTLISNTAAGLHREHLGRGPGAVRSFVTEDLIVCVLSDPFTVAERILIDAGKIEWVRATRAAHQAAVETTYRDRMAQAVGRPVIVCVGTVGMRPDRAVDVFILGPGQDGPSTKAGDRRAGNP